MWLIFINIRCVLEKNVILSLLGAVFLLVFSIKFFFKFFNLLCPYFFCFLAQLFCQFLKDVYRNLPL